MTAPSSCSHCGSNELVQEEDVLDTWFSSWLWPLSPFGWPNSSTSYRKDLDYYYPTSVLVTAPEIIFLWVARMVMAGLKFNQKVPFKDIYFNATVCDKKGRKFSKTLGNGIEPLEVIDRHGADAVRFTAVSLAPLGGRIRMEVKDFENGARFVNKLWNAWVFLSKSLTTDTTISSLDGLPLTRPEQWLVSRLHESTESVNQLLDDYRVNEAVEKIYHYFWGDFCDWAIETGKYDLTHRQDRNQTLSVLLYCLEGALRLAHPVIPFITEEIWQNLPPHPDWDRPKSIAVAAYPIANNIGHMPEQSSQWQMVQSLISDVRSLRGQTGIPPKEKLQAVVFCNNDTVKQVLKESRHWIVSLANLSSLDLADDQDKPRQSLVAIGKTYQVFLPVGGLLDVAAERKRLTSEYQRLDKIICGLEKKLQNADFCARAPAEVIEASREQFANLSQQRHGIKANLNGLK